MIKKKIKVVLALTNDLLYDARVNKMATTLSKEYDVTIVCLNQDRNVNYNGLPYEVVAVKGAGIRSQTSFIKRISRRLPRQLIEIFRDIPVYKLRRKSAMRMRDALIEQSADIYVANDLDTLEVVSSVAKSLGKKIVYDSHELCVDCYSYTFLGRLLWSRLEKKYIPNVDAVITTNKYRAKILNEMYGINPFVIKNIPILSSSLRRIDDDTIDLIYVGNYTLDRGLLEIIDAMVLVPENYCLHFMGLGSLEKNMVERIKELGLNERAILHKPVKNDEVTDAIAQYDIGIVTYLPSNQNNYYCSPNKLYEYIQAGLGILSIDLPEPRDVITECDNGVLFKDYSPLEISKSIKNMKTEDVLRFKDNSSIAKQKYNWEAQEDLLLSIYSEVADLLKR